MNRLFLSSIVLMACFNSFSQVKMITQHLVPLPVSVKEGTGNFIVNNKTTIHLISSDASVARVGNFLSEKLKITGFTIPVTKSSSTGNSISLNIVSDASLGGEGYKLNASANNVTISANKPAGLFYGMQTLLQLMPTEIENKDVVKNVSWKIPACNILDYPRFGWRGLMFDVARHFFTKAEVKKYIDEMVRYKYNLLHLHLTDDEGWRIEIKSLPQLTEVGAWNVKRVGYFGTFQPPSPDEPRNYGGFYTQDDIKEIVQYAKDRFVDILPEIDVPGHSLAAIAAYPELACSAGQGPKPEVSSGQNIKDWSTHTALIDDNLCPANENVYEFLDMVLTEIARLFPFDYIHMGGDETFKTFWERSDAVKELMQKENLKSMEEVQSYFEKRVEKIVESKGKKFMGWDEILEGGLAPSAAVMSWRGMKGGIEAAKQKHDVVMSPTDFAYIDYMQGDPIVEPHIYSTLLLKKAYSFEPIPPGVDAKYIKGGQANLWSEQLYTFRHAEYMTWPRGVAISEALWSPKEKRNWENFFPRLENQFKRLDEAEIKYSPSVYDPIFNVTATNDKQVKVELSVEATGVDIYYTFDNTFPDNFSAKYTAPVTVPKESVMLKVITYKGKTPVGRLIYMPVDELKKRSAKKE